MGNDNLKFIKRVWILSIPIIAQQFIQAALNLVDTVMIGRLGSDEIAAVGIANQVFFLVMMIIFGINSGVSVYIAQFFGRNDTNNIRKTMGVSLSAGLIIGLVFCLMALLVPRQIMSLFVSEANVINLGVKYLKIIAFSYVFISISMSFHVASRSIGQTLVPMLVSAIALTLNTLLNYGLIFGNFGLPSLGVQGAAIATLIARILEFILMMIIIYGGKSILAASFKDLTSFSKKFVTQIFEKAGPVLINEIFWCLGTVGYMWAIGKIDADAVASYQISGSIFRFYEVIFIGFASAAGVMIGNSIGGNEEGVAIVTAHRLIKFSFYASIMVSCVMFVLTPSILSLFNVTANVTQASRIIFNIYCLYGISRVFNLMMIVGVLRGGGDTKFTMTMEIITVWLIGVPLAILGAVILKLPVEMVVLMILTEELVKSVICFTRLRSNNWLHNVISHIE